MTTENELIDGVDRLGVDLFWADVGRLSADQEGGIKSLMSPAEISRCRCFRHEPSRQCYLITRYLVRSTLAELGGRSPGDWEFGAGEKGRPFLKNPTPEITDLDFNIAHSRSRVVLAIIRGARVGVDLEPVGRKVDYDLVASRFFHRRERRALKKISGAERHRRFLALWVLKEAWLKADGRGISAGLDRVVFAFDQQDKDGQGQPRLEQIPGDQVDDWRVDMRQVDDHLLGLAVRSKSVSS